MSNGTPIDLLRGGKLYCCLCERILKEAFLDVTFADGKSFFCERLTWLNCLGCEDPNGHRVCGLCIERYKLEAVPDDANAASGRPRRAWEVCPDALAVARKLMGTDSSGPKLYIEGVPYSVTSVRETTITVNAKIQPKKKRGCS